MFKVNTHLPSSYTGKARPFFLAAAVGMVLVGGTVLVSAAVRPGDDADSGPVLPPPLPILTLSIELQPAYEARRVFVGRVEPSRESAVGFELAGLLRNGLVDEGDVVTVDQVLARLDTTRLQARRQELAAALEEAEANQALARITVKRLEGVVDAGGISRQGLDEAREAYRAARAATALARSRIETLDVDLAKSELRALYGAVVTTRHADEGRVLTAGTPVLTLQERMRPEVRVGIAGRLADTVAVGQSYPVEVRGETVTGRVKAVLPVRGAGTRTVDVLLTLEDAEPAVRSGDLAVLALSETVTGDGYWLPISALAEGNRGLWSVYVMDPVENRRLRGAPSAASHRVVPHLVEVLHEESDRVFVQGALEPGAIVAAAGLHRVVPGQLVRLSDNTRQRLANGRTRHVVH